MRTRSKAAGIKRDLPIPSLVWWFLALVGLSVRVAFMLKGNIAFDSDEAFHYSYIRRLMTGDLDDYLSNNTLAGFREGVACLFFWLTRGWVYFGSLAAIVLTGLVSVLWVHWIHDRVSKWAALGTALAFTFPSASISYFATHLEERRVETIFWGTCLVYFSGRWLDKAWSALLLGAIMGWAFWCEPFILFFALPVLVYEFWKKKRSGGLGWIPVGSMFAGLFGGLLSGHAWNGAFTVLLGPTYLNWGPKDWTGIRWHLSLLWNAFPQVWNGNFSLGYLQNSALGLQLIPVFPGTFSRFLGFWTIFMVLFGAWGFIRSASRKEMESRWCAVLCAGPAVCYFGFFIFSGQVWDASSFRYVAFWVFYFAVGVGLGFHHLFQRNRRVGITVLGLFVLVQSSILVGRLETLSFTHPAIAIDQGFEAVGLRAGYANYWVSEAGRYLSNDRILLANYDSDKKETGSTRVWNAVHGDERVGIVKLDGLDNPVKIEQTGSRLERDGYEFVKVWPMMGHWEILEFDKKRRAK